MKQLITIMILLLSTGCWFNRSKGAPEPEKGTPPPALENFRMVDGLDIGYVYEYSPLSDRETVILCDVETIIITRDPEEVKPNILFPGWYTKTFDYEAGHAVLSNSDHLHGQSVSTTSVAGDVLGDMVGWVILYTNDDTKIAWADEEDIIPGEDTIHFKVDGSVDLIDYVKSNNKIDFHGTARGRLPQIKTYVDGKIIVDSWNNCYETVRE